MTCDRLFWALWYRLIVFLGLSLHADPQVNVPPAPCGEVKIEVTFNIDASGVVYMFAKDAVTGEEKDLQEDGQFDYEIITAL